MLLKFVPIGVNFTMKLITIKNTYKTTDTQRILLIGKSHGILKNNLISNHQKFLIL